MPPHQPISSANDSDVPESGALSPTHAAGTAPNATTSRRALLAATGGALTGGLAVWLLKRPPQPLDDDGLPTAEFHVGAVDDVVERIRGNGPLLLPEESGPLAVVLWQPSYRSEAGSALDRYGPEGEDHPVIDATTGVMVLSLASTHLGCRVAFCNSSQWFEDPCHGSRWNRWGEWTGGPAPRGLDRYRSRVTDHGELVASLTDQIVGPSRENGVFEQPAQGPNCIDG